MWPTSAAPTTNPGTAHSVTVAAARVRTMGRDPTSISTFRTSADSSTA